MAMSLIHRRIRRQAIEIALAFDVIHPDALSAFDHDVQRMIIVRSILLFERDKFWERGSGMRCLVLA